MASASDVSTSTSEAANAVTSCSSNSCRRALYATCSAARRTMASAVRVGFRPDPVTKTLVSQTKRLGTSCDWQNPLTTDCDGSSPMRHDPIAWAP